MLKKIVPAATAAILLSLASFEGAAAWPVAAPLPATGGPEITLVEGGCGPGWHRTFGGRCVPNGGPVVVVPGGPPAVVVAPAPAVVAPPPPAVVVAPPVVVAPAPVVCGVGFRWHPGRRRCVVL
jgi:hypothetical protein